MNRMHALRGRRGRFSYLIAGRTIAILAALAALTVIGMVLGVGLGSTFISPAEVARTLLGQGTADHALVIEVLRMPRIIVAVLVGAALGVSGAILQGMIRNPLASPDMIGITGGAAFAAVAFITFLAGAVSIGWLPVAALLGAAAISAMIYLLAWNKGVTPTRLVLIGIGISAATGSLTMLMIVFSPITSAGQAYIWLTGSIYGASWDNVYTLLPWVAVFLPLAFVLSRHITVQELGDDVARGLGSRVQLQRCVLLLVSVALAGAAVAVAGAIGFVGLIAPHIARKLTGPAFGGLVPVAGLTGGLIVLIADTAARTAFAPHDIPAGVFTAGVGAPFFIYLLYRNRNR